MSSPTKLAFAKAADAKINPPKSSGVGMASTTPTNKAALNKSKLVKGAKKIGNAVAGKKKQLKKGVGGKVKATSPKTKKAGKEEGGDGTLTKKNARGMGDEGGQDGQDVGEPKTDILPQPKAPPELAAAPKVKGKVKIRYNHYCEEMEIEATEGKCDGTINVAKIVDLLALDFAFPGNFIAHLNTSARLERLDRLWNPKNEAGTITGLQIGKDYFCDIEEDKIAEANVVRTAYKGLESGETSMIGGKREEGCSCLFGNPCMEAYTCKNWSKREEIAKANGWKGYS